MPRYLDPCQILSSLVTLAKRPVLTQVMELVLDVGARLPHRDDVGEVVPHEVEAVPLDDAVGHGGPGPPEGDGAVGDRQGAQVQRHGRNWKKINRIRYIRNVVICQC